MVVKADSKYFPLYEFLRRSNDKKVSLTFAEIEQILGAALPASARESRAFWSNRGRGAVQAAAWMESGYHVVEIDIAREQVVFGRSILRYEVRRTGDDVLWDGDMIRALRAHLRLNQAELAKLLGVRQQTVSEWETSTYTPTRARSKHLTLVAEQHGFYLGGGEQEIDNRPVLGLDKNIDTV